MAAWYEERGDTTKTDQWDGMVKLSTIERMVAAMTSRTRQVRVNNPESGAIEVPVHRIAEYIPGSFLAVDEEAEDALNDSEARIYKVSDDAMALVYNQGVLTFDCNALRLVLDRLTDMSTTDLAEVLDLVED